MLEKRSDTQGRELEQLYNKYTKLLEMQQFDEQSLDYSIMEKHTPVLMQLAAISNSIITVFDVSQKKHIFNSGNYDSFLGYSKEDFEKGGEFFLDGRTHPDDRIAQLRNGIILWDLLTRIPNDLRYNCKLINEFRILNATGQYTRVIEQHQALELDKRGNIWLAISILDISPNQNAEDTLKAQILNFRTGDFVDLLGHKHNAISLSKREIEILKHVKRGKQSKEISDELNISIHTVNTHRQKILEKLNADNSIEAIEIASRLGII
jgi:DNA-binding CsgD family transcriptional regulator